jgi:hypothetical protein
MRCDDLAARFWLPVDITALFSHDFLQANATIENISRAFHALWNAYPANNTQHKITVVFLENETTEN